MYLGILLVAVNLRPALASVGPLVDAIRRSTGLSNSQLGLLTTLPLLAFGVMSTLTPLLTRRLGVGGTMLLAMVLLALGSLMRGVTWISALYVGTLFCGVAIAFGNVLLPSIAKRNFPSQAGFITSCYSSAMGLGACVAAGVSLPLASDLQLGWRGVLGIWALPAVLAAAVWLPQLKQLNDLSNERSFVEGMRHLGMSRLAWYVALFMGFQSFTFYVILAWLPALLIDRGFEPVFAGWMLSLSQAVGILGSLIVPTVAGKNDDQRHIVLCLAVMEAVAIFGLLLPDFGWVEVWVSVIGFALGGTFGLALLFIVVRSDAADTATELSGMAQSVGYLVAATGPVVFGGIFDVTGNWTYPLLLLLSITVLKFLTGWGAGKPGTVDGE